MLRTLPTDREQGCHRVPQGSGFGCRGPAGPSCGLASGQRPPVQRRLYPHTQGQASEALGRIHRAVGVHLIQDEEGGLHKQSAREGDAHAPPATEVTRLFVLQRAVEVVTVYNLGSCSGQQHPRVHGNRRVENLLALCRSCLLHA